MILDFFSRVVDVKLNDDKLVAVILEDGEVIYGDAFVETTGSTGTYGETAQLMVMDVQCVY